MPASHPVVVPPQVFFRRFSLIAGAAALVLLALLVLLTIWANAQKKQEVLAQAQAQHTLLAQAYVASLQAWLARSTQVADEFAASAAAREFASGFATSGAVLDNFQRIFNQLGEMQRLVNGVAAFNGVAVAVTDPVGLPVLSSVAGQTPTPAQQAAAQEAVAQNRTAIAQARQTPAGVFLDVYKPILGVSEPTQPVGALWVQLPLDAGFAALEAQARDRAGDSAIVLWQKQEGVVFQLTGNPPGLTALAQPLDQPQDQFLTVTHAVPGSPWWVTVQTPLAVALAPWQQYQMTTTLLLVLALGLVAVVIALTYWWLMGLQYRWRLQQQVGEAKLADQAVNALARTIEARDPYLAGHSVRVAEVATQLAARLGADPIDQFALRVAAKLMGIGKLSVPMEVLNKATPLTAAERRQLQAHILHAEKVLLEVDFPAPVHTIISHSAERTDGSGYPRQLAGEAIHPLARVLMVADVFCALTEPRVYREKMSDTDALKVIFAERHRYDEAVLNALAEMLAGPTA